MQKERVLNSMVLRRAIEEDIPQLCALYWEFHHFHVLGLPERLRMPDDPLQEAHESERLERELCKIIQRGDAIFFVAELEGKVVGFAEAYLHQDEEQPLTVAHRSVHLQSLLVSAPYRKRGLGNALMQAVHQWAKEQGAREIQLEAWEFPEGPVSFYERMGYKTLRRYMVIDVI